MPWWDLALVLRELLAWDKAARIHVKTGLRIEPLHLKLRLHLRCAHCVLGYLRDCWIELVLLRELLVALVLALVLRECLGLEAHALVDG